METENEVIVTNPDALLNTEDRRLSEAIRDLDRAEATYAENVDRHPWVQSGSNSDAIKAELDARFRPGLDAARESALAAAETIHANSRAVFLQSQHAEYVLSDSEMVSASNRAGFIADDVASLSYGRLVDAVRFAVAKGDKAAMYVYAREIPKRLNRDRDNPDWGGSTAQAERDQLSKLLTSIDGTLRDRSLEPLNKRAADLMIRAGDLRNRIEKPRMAARTYAFSGEHDVSW